VTKISKKRKKCFLHLWYGCHILRRTNSFIPGLKPSLSASPSHRSLSFSSLGLTTWFPRLLSSSSSSFICSNQLNKKTHTWSTREQEQDKKVTETGAYILPIKKNKWKTNTLDIKTAMTTHTVQTQRNLSDRLDLDNDEKSTVWGKTVFNCFFSEHIRFYFFVFFVLHFLVVGSVR